MANLNNAIRQLRQERKHAQLQVEKLDSAISVLEGLTGSSSATATRNGSQPKRRVTAASRRRMARAQRARWARSRKGSPANGAPRVKRTLSPAARRKIAVAQRARWAEVRAQQSKKAA